MATPATTSTIADEFRALCAAHDLTYDYSDDIAVWRAGRDEATRILDLAKKLPREEAAAIWNAEVDRKLNETARHLFRWEP